MTHKTMRSILSVLLAALLLVTSIPLTPAFAEEGGAVSLQSESGESEGLKGDGTANEPYQIATAEQLAAFRDKVNRGETNACAVLTADIDLSGVGNWIPIGSNNLYSGTFDGDGHTISGLNITGSENDQGLFRYVGTTGKIEKLTVDGTVSSSAVVGGIVARNSGRVENCAFRVSVSGSDCVGGVVGQNNGTVTNCTNTGKVSGSVGSSVGGIVGQNNSGGTVENCYNTGSVSGSTVGGVVGNNSGTVTNCYNTGSVTGSGNLSNVGGVVGQNGDTVTNCYNTGEVSGSGSNSFVGGVVGQNGDTVTDCYNTGKVTVTGGSGSYVGGVVGANGSGTVTGCYFL